MPQDELVPAIVDVVDQATAALGKIDRLEKAEVARKRDHPVLVARCVLEVDDSRVRYVIGSDGVVEPAPDDLVRPDRRDDVLLGKEHT
jgi:hypothetical protein